MHQYRQRRSSGNIFPFFVLIGIGISVVVVVQVFLYFRHSALSVETGKILLYNENGASRILHWGSSDWSFGGNGDALLEGDSVRSEKESRIVLDFFGENFVRLDQNTELKIETLDSGDTSSEVYLILRQGRIWVSSLDGDHRAEFVVDADEIRVSPAIASYSVTQDLNGMASVRTGEIDVSVMSRESERTRMLEHFTVSGGQSIFVSDRDVRDLMEFRTIYPVSELSPQFLESEWYAWNRLLDESPIDYKKRRIVSEKESGNGESEIDSIPKGPVISLLSPETPYTTSDRIVEFRGTASFDTERITIIAEGESYRDVYTLRGYEAGSPVWVYRAAPEFHNLEYGENRYSIVGEDGEGNESEPVSVKVLRE